MYLFRFSLEYGYGFAFQWKRRFGTNMVLERASESRHQPAPGSSARAQAPAVVGRGELEAVHLADSQYELIFRGVCVGFRGVRQLYINIHISARTSATEVLFRCTLIISWL